MRKVLLFLCLMAAASATFGASNVLLWDDMSTNETGFSVERKPEACAGTGAFGIIGTVASNIATFADSTVTEGVTYCYRVRAAGLGGLFSGYSNTAERLVPFTAPAAPSGLKVQGGP